MPKRKVALGKTSRLTKVMVKPINFHLQVSTYAVQFVKVVLVGEEDGEEDEVEDLSQTVHRVPQSPNLLRLLHLLPLPLLPTIPPLLNPRQKLFPPRNPYYAVGCTLYHSRVRFSVLLAAFLNLTCCQCRPPCISRFICNSI